MTWVLSLMVTALVIALLSSFRSDSIWHRMLAYASVSNKAAVLILAFSVLRDDLMIGLVGVIALSMGNAGLMLLAHLLKRLEVEC